MNARKFTAGPWRSVPTTLHGIGTLTIRCDVVSDGAPYSPAFIAGDITPSDAALIAAAPELYEALSALLDQFEQRGIATDSAHPDRVAVTQARAALAKAAQS